MEKSSKKPTPKTEMITVEGLIKVKKQNVISLFSDNKKINPMIELVRKEVIVDKVDLSTKKGRDEIASRAYKVSKMKGAVVKQIIDPSVEEYKASVKSVGIGKKHWNDEMDALRDEVRAPLNKWEAEEKIKEEKRISDIKNNISGIINLAVLPLGREYEKNYVSEMIEAVDNIDCSEGFDEFAQDALQAKANVKEALSQCLNTIIQKELEETQRKEMVEQQAKLDESQRIMDLKAKAQERLNNLMMIPTGFYGKSSSEINSKIELLDNYQVLESEFGELWNQACATKQQVINQLSLMYDQQKTVEQAEAQQDKSEIVDQEELIRKIAQEKQNLVHADTAQAQENQQRNIDDLESQLTPKSKLELEIVRETQRDLSCDGEHGGPKCGDPGCWNDDKTNQGSVAEAAPTLSSLKTPSRFNQGSHYRLISCEGEENIVYFYLNPDANCLGFGFNISDGGGFLPEHDLRSGSVVDELVITFK